MSRFTLIALSCAVTLACGPEESKGPAADAASPVASPEQQDPRSPVGRDNMALVLENASELPVCASENQSQLVYLKSSSRFVSCDKGSWLEVIIKAEKGEKGEAGAAGANGAQGEKGEAGPKGQDGASGPKGDKGDKGDTGEAGEDGELVSGNQWVDPATGQRWYTGASVTLSYVNFYVSIVCAPGWRLATGEELRLAILRGIPSATYWSSDLSNGNTERSYVQVGGTVVSTSTGSESHKLACLKQ